MKPENGTTIKKKDFFSDFFARSTILSHHTHPYVQTHDYESSKY
jgi:hypothetical protein